MSLNALSRYDDAEDEIRDEDHNLVAPSVSLKDSDDSQSASDYPSRPSSVVDSKPKSLVSYIGGEYSDDNSSSDGENEDDARISKPMTTASLGFFDSSSVVSSAGSNSPSDTVVENLESIKDAFDTIRLPPEPEGRCSKSLQEKIAQMLEKKRQGLNINDYVQSKKDFRNPSIYEKLVNFIGIDEHGTNFPKHLYDPSVWGSESYYDALAKTQKEHHDKKEKEKLKRTHVEFIKGTKKSVTAAPPVANGVEKKSKWDQKIPPSIQTAIKSNEVTK